MPKVEEKNRIQNVKNTRIGENVTMVQPWSPAASALKKGNQVVPDMNHATTSYLIVIDPAVYGCERWLDRSQSTNTDVLVFNKGFDGMTQIADDVVSRPGRFVEIHIVSHDSDGALHLGSTTLTRSNIGGYATEMIQIGQLQSRAAVWADCRRDFGNQRERPPRHCRPQLCYWQYFYRYRSCQ